MFTYANRKVSIFLPIIILIRVSKPFEKNSLTSNGRKTLIA